MPVSQKQSSGAPRRVSERLAARSRGGGVRSSVGKRARSPPGEPPACIETNGAMKVRRGQPPRGAANPDAVVPTGPVTFEPPAAEPAVAAAPSAASASATPAAAIREAATPPDVVSPFVLSPTVAAPTSDAPAAAAPAAEAPTPVTMASDAPESAATTARMNAFVPLGAAQMADYTVFRPDPMETYLMEVYRERRLEAMVRAQNAPPPYDSCLPFLYSLEADLLPPTDGDVWLYAKYILGSAMSSGQPEPGQKEIRQAVLQAQAALLSRNAVGAWGAAFLALEHFLAVSTCPMSSRLRLLRHHMLPVLDGGVALAAGVQRALFRLWMAERLRFVQY